MKTRYHRAAPEPPSLIHSTPEEWEEHNRQVDAYHKAREKPLAEEIAEAKKAGNGATEKKPEAPGTIVVMASDIAPEPIDWLWKNFLARGKLHIFAGVPETGKTILALAYAAIISAGWHWPDGTRARIGRVLLWTNEDDAADTIVPRLIRMGADMTKTGIAQGHRDKNGNRRPFNPSIDMPSLTAKAKEMGGVYLLVLDPVVAVVPASRDSHNNAQTRAGLQPVVDYAEAASSAVIGVTHYTKGTSNKEPLERITDPLLTI